MREIKFRIPNFNRDGSFSHFSYWGAIDYYGNPVLDHSIFTSPGNTSSTTKGWHEQYTGLKDKDGKEIYEGDIFCSYYHLEKGKPNHAPVVYENGAFTWHGKPLGYDEEALEPSSTDWGIITGNIYENPDLLTQPVSRNP